MIPGLSTDEERDLILSVGTHRPGRMLTPVEVAELLQRALDAGASSESIAKRCLLEGTTTISRFLRLLDLEEASKHLVVFGSKKGSLGFTTAMEVAGLGDLGVQKQLVHSILANGLSSTEVKSVCQRLKRSSVTTDVAVEEILALRPTISRFYVLVGAIEGASSRAVLSEMSQTDRDELLRRILNELGFDGSGHLGVTRFTLSTENPQTASVSMEDLETSVNTLLMEEIC